MELKNYKCRLTDEQIRLRIEALKNTGSGAVCSTFAIDAQALEELLVYRRVLVDLPDGCIEGGWTARGASAYTAALENDLRQMAETLREGEWAEHIASTDAGQLLEIEITRLIGNYAGSNIAPVAWTDAEELRSLKDFGLCEMFSVEPITPGADMYRVIPLYTTPQTLNILQDGSDPRDAFETVFSRPPFAERCGAGYCCNAFSAWRANEFIQRWEGWNACRVAILKGGAV